SVRRSVCRFICPLRPLFVRAPSALRCGRVRREPGARPAASPPAPAPIFGRPDGRLERSRPPGDKEPMFVGHYAPALVAKAVEPRVPLWALFLAVQLVDVAWALLVLLGVERAHLDATLASNPLALDHMPFTHSF